MSVVHYIFSNGKDTQINKTLILPSASFNLAAELRHGPTLLASLIEGAGLHESSTDKVFQEFREIPGDLPEELILDLGLERQGRLKHTKIGKKEHF